MASDGKIVIDLDLTSSKLDKKLKNTEKKSKKAGAKAGKGFGKKFNEGAKKGIDDTSKGISGLGLAAVGAGAVVAIAAIANSISTLVSAANQQEDAVNRLNSSLRITGRFTTDASLRIQDFASALQGASRFGDEVILENAALIQSLGDLDEKGLKRATKASADLASALGIDLRSAATLVGKAAVGEIGSFSRYGVVIKKGADNAETFEKTLTALEKKFGGAALAQIDTFAGAQQQLSNTFGDTIENLGLLITQSDLARGFIDALSTTFIFYNKLLNPAKPKLTEQIASTTEELDKLKLSLDKANNTALSLADKFFDRTFDFDASGAVAIQKQLDITKEKLLSLRREQSKEQKAISIAAEEKRIATLARLEETAAANLLRLGIVTNKALNEQEAEKLEALKLGNELKLITGREYLDAREAVEKEFAEKRKKGRELEQIDTQLSLAAHFNKIQADFSKNAGSMTKTTAKFSKDVSKILIGGLANAVGTSFASFGAALANGENGLKAFASSFGKQIGTMSVQLGQAFIMQGAAMFFSPSAEHNAKAGPLIATGAALATFGGALGATIGGGGAGSSSSSAAAGGGASNGTFESSFATDQIQEEAVERSPQVTVNVAGDILDSDESGSRIIDLINSAVDGQGVTIRRNAIA